MNAKVKFNKNLIARGLTNSVQPLMLDYIYNNDNFSELISYGVDNESFIKIIEARPYSSVVRKTLSVILEKQYSKFTGSELHPETRKNLDAMHLDDTYTVCCGHQLNILTGPLYFIYKIASTINLARSVSVETGRRVVPVFWMATEDHDMAEVSGVHISGIDYKWDTDWQGPSGKADVSGIREIVKQLSARFEQNDESFAWLDLFNAAYTENRNLADASRNLVNALFGKYGLIILDADDKELKKLFAPYMVREIREKIVHDAVPESYPVLKDKYQNIQAEPRIVNLFYLTDSSRVRIDMVDQHFQLQDSSKTWTEEEIVTEINSHPEKFSPNVLFRPVYQEFLLPNLAFVGGPSEIAYWLELKAVFREFGVAFPMLVTRNSVLFLDQQMADKQRKFELADEDLFHSADDWIRNWMSKSAGESFSLQDEKDKLDQLMSGIAERAAEIEPTLRQSVDAETQKIHKSFENLEGKLLRGLKRKHEQETGQLKNLKDKLFPGGGLQERKENIITLLFRYNLSLIDTLVDELDPLKKDFIILKENSTTQ